MTSLTSLSYAFIPYRIGNEIIPRPMLPVTLKRTSQTFPTMLLVDSGADYSMLQREIVQEALHIDISTLPEKGETSGVTGKAKIAWITVKVLFGQKNLQFEEDIPFQVSLEPEKDTPLSLLGRLPFFYKYRVDYRMGYTTDPALGKFVIYPETHKRQPDDYRRPMNIKR
ncbi:MAG: retroviral-like aspartic protease family protein [Thermoplasmata archaeon]|nr:hypothetical protein [Thermoplasmata archaeon]MCJ7698211.1 retroviral-like aspartic protease family protein [Thermoplasmata archaeon]